MLENPSRFPLHDSSRLMRVAVLLSGSGTNAVEILKYQKEHPDCNYDVVLLLSDKKKDCKIEEIGNEFGIDNVVLSKKWFNAPDEAYNKTVAGVLKGFEIDHAAMAGYGGIVDTEILYFDERRNDLFLPRISNVHPGHLGVTGEQGRPVYVGWYEKPIKKAIMAGEKTLYSTCHLAIEVADEGPILMISDGLPVDLEGKTLDYYREHADELHVLAGKHQNQLKEVGDWKIFPLTLALLAQGRFAQDKDKNLYFDNKLITTGVNYKDVV